jgi:hypothetical protein
MSERSQSLEEQDWDIVYAEPVSDDEDYAEADRAVTATAGSRV